MAKQINQNIRNNTEDKQIFLFVQKFVLNPHGTKSLIKAPWELKYK